MKQLTQEQLEQVYREHPEWRTGIEVGKWYKLPYDYEFLFCVTELLDTKYARGYGWGEDGKWYGVNGRIWHTGNLILATQKEVEAALMEEAKRRYKIGDRIKSLRNDWVQTIGKMRVNVYTPTKGGGYWTATVVAEEDEWNEMCSNPYVFTDGKWATVIAPASPLAEDIQALKDKYPNYNWTIIAEEKK